MKTTTAILVLTLIATNYVEAQVPQIERDALIALYNSTDGDNWTNNTDWLGAAGTECGWYGVFCQDGHVQSLNLGSNQLTGSLPAELGDLTSLTTLWMYSNQLTGSIPPQIGNLTSLRDMQLNSNQLAGNLPSEMGNLSSLQDLRLFSNQLNGPIPPQFGDLSSLSTLSMSNNQLSGSIPAEIGDLSDLELLYLSNNQLSGSIPPQIGNLANLQDLRLSSNQLSGSIPPEIGDLGNLTTLQLDINGLHGAIPPEIGDLSSLHNLRLGSNELSGAIPPEIGDLSSLQSIDLSRNLLSGDTPTALGGLTGLTSMSLSYNRLQGTIPPEIGNLIGLNTLSLESNRLHGDIPGELANLAALNTNGLDLRHNALYSDDPTLIAFLDSKQNGGDWQQTQTVPPENVTVEWVGDHTVWLSWDTVTWTAPGGYEALVAPSAGGPWVSAGRTASKTEIEMPVTALDPGVSYDLAVTTFTDPNGWNDNLVISDPSDPLMATTADLGCATPVIDVAWGYPTTLSLTVAFDSYVWSTGETTPAIDVDPTQPRFYWVTVTSTGSCQESAIILADPGIFTDGFESGDTSVWGS